MPDRTKIPPHSNNDLLKITEPEEVAFDNGLHAYLIDAGDEDVTRIDVIIQAGTAFQKKKLVAGTVGKLLKEGTRNFDSSAIANTFDSLGAYFDTTVTKDSITLSLFTLTKHLAALLPLISEMITEATFPEHEMHIHLDRQRQEYLINSEKVRYLAMLEFNKLVFGEESAYGQTVRLSDFDSIHHEHLVDFYKEKYSVDNAYVIISGRANGEVSSLVNKYLGNGWNHSNNRDESVVYKSDYLKGNRYIEKKDAMQSAIRIGKPMINKQHPDYNKFILLNTVLGGYFGSRLMSNLREEKGYTYGVSSFTSNYIHGSSFSIVTEVNANHTNAAIDQILFEMDKLTEEKVGKDELELVKNYINGTFLRNFDGPFALAERFRSVKDFGLGFDYYLNSLEDIMNITSDELLETANKYFDTDQMIKLVVGKLS
jgi:predicted Zn-dependent peptidase